MAFAFIPCRLFQPNNHQNTHLCFLMVLLWFHRLYFLYFICLGFVLLEGVKKRCHFSFQVAVDLGEILGNIEESERGGKYFIYLFIYVHQQRVESFSSYAVEGVLRWNGARDFTILTFYFRANFYILMFSFLASVIHTFLISLLPQYQHIFAVCFPFCVVKMVNFL